MTVEKVAHQDHPANTSFLGCPFCAHRPVIKFRQANHEPPEPVKVDFPGYYLLIVRELEIGNQGEPLTSCGGVSFSGWSYRQIREKWNTRAAIQAMAGEWQPIEAAPRDKPILGGYFNQPWTESHREGRIVKCWYQPEFEAFISSCREMTLASGYTFEDGSSRRLHSPEIEAVTHWTPIPADPPAKVREIEP